MSVYEIVTNPDGSQKVVDAISRRPIIGPEAEQVLVSKAIQESRPPGSPQEVKTKCGAN